MTVLIGVLKGAKVGMSEDCGEEGNRMLMVNEACISYTGVFSSRQYNLVLLFPGEGYHRSS